MHIKFFYLEPNQKYIFSLIALNENNDTVIPEQFYDFQMPSEGKSKKKLILNKNQIFF